MMKSDKLVQEVIESMRNNSYDMTEPVKELCRYHIEMRDHALRLERILHAILKDDEKFFS